MQLICSYLQFTEKNVKTIQHSGNLIVFQFHFNKLPFQKKNQIF